MSDLQEKTNEEAVDRSFNDDATVNCDATPRRSISGSSGRSSKKEIDETHESAVADPETNDLPPSDDDVPDGGLRAWLVILGVSHHPPYPLK